MVNPVWNCTDLNRGGKNTKQQEEIDRQNKEIIVVIFSDA